MLRRTLLITSLCLIAGLPAATAWARTGHFSVHSASSSAATPKQALARVARLMDGQGVRKGTELTPALKELAESYDRLSPTDRRRAKRLMARPTDTGAGGSEERYQAGLPVHSFASAHFVIHWVDATADAPSLADTGGVLGVPDYVETMSRVFENVYSVENGQLGWRAPKSDGTRGGGDGLTDVYIKQLGNQKIFGYSSPDPDQETRTQFAYLVMDNDYSQAEYSRYSDPLPPMEVTAAHEYNHVLQFGYDVLEDTWMFEGTAVWMEDRVYDDVNDYVNYLRDWTKLSLLPMTQYNASNRDDPYNVKVYGDAVWSRWLDDHYGQQVLRGAWERSLGTRPASFAPAAYDASLVASGHNRSFFNAFTSFAAQTAEWRAAGSGFFSEGSTFPDMQRTGDDQSPGAVTLVADGSGLIGTLDHTTYALFNVRPTSAARVKVVGAAPAGTRSAFALVGRVGDEVTGKATVALKRLSNGGAGSVSLSKPGRFQRITAVAINGDARSSSYSARLQDWVFSKDKQEMTVRVSTDYKPPSVRVRAPRPNQRNVSARSRVIVSFSEPVGTLSTHTLILRASNGHVVRAKVTYDRKKRRATLTPTAKLKHGARYTISLSSAIADGGGNSLPSKQRRWTFTTRR
ncbi:MAG: hypothetical protein QOE08_1619 [Thermoleophilaceae bacterium]|nr:hypothetical protein [Thermoleophilaceae bacterium]